MAPVLFGAVVAAVTVLEYDFATELGWDPVRRSDAGWPSFLALADAGWLVVSTFALCGVLGLAFVVGFERSAPATVWTTVASALLAVLALAVGLEAFKTDPPGSVVAPTWHGEIHDAVYPVLVVAALVAPIAVARALWHAPGWGRCGVYSLAAAAALVLFLILQANARYGQLFEYFYFGTLLVWLELLAARAWKVTS